MTQVEVLELWNTNITDEGLAHLGKLPRLHTLDMSGTRITAAGLKHLNGCTGLVSFACSETGVTPEELKRWREGRNAAGGKLREDGGE